MCVYSMITDHYRDKWSPAPAWPVVPPPYFVPLPALPATPAVPLPTKEEIGEFRKDMAEMKKLLGRARKYDADTGQPDCDLDEKKKALKEVADRMGVAVEFP